jgi:hypothetical protein
MRIEVCWQTARELLKGVQLLLEDCAAALTGLKIEKRLP